MPAARGVKRTASKSSAATSSSGPKNKKKRGGIQLDIPTAHKKRGRVFACGQGDVGQLGLGEDVIETSKFKHVTALGDKVVEVRAGGMHTVVLDSDGKVWTFGCNDEGALGRQTSGEAEEAAPRGVTLPARALRLAAGDSHSAALLASGDVYVWGSFRDSHGSMGLVIRGRAAVPSREPVRVPLPEPVADLASGADHLVLLTTSGSVYTMGCGEQGQLGRLSQRSASREARQGFSALLVPSKVTLKGGASKVWAGYHATFALDATKEKLFAWGLNNYGQLGITGEKRKTALYSPVECDAFPTSGAPWRALAAGQHHSLAVDGAGRLRAVGRCEYGRLGLGDRVGDAEVPEPVPKLENKKCISIAAGISNSFAVTDTGELYAWGMGSEGQLGTGASSDANEPTLILPHALLVSAGGQHTLLLQEDPSGPKEDSPEPEQETAEQKEDEEEIEEENEKVPEKPKGRPNKRQKKQDQEDEVTSTSSAQPSEVAEENKPQKLNGDEKKETPMEVDETDNTQEKEPEKTETETVTEPATANTQSETTETKEDKTETDSSQETDSETKSQESQEDNLEKLNDVEMEKEVNGAPEVVETKTVESIAAANPLTTTA
ncbi:regulator of chromosome condensation-like [Achroia grisella]|uniref:regulator of chromosome condensation-like n=1 Tax=Achroia grisella TaxID=688607 RepID=UPI0027D2D142|nr:regulator of chromosome condensation-like [Achroia grisella]